MSIRSTVGEKNIYDFNLEVIEMKSDFVASCFGDLTVKLEENLSVVVIDQLLSVIDFH